MPLAKRILTATATVGQPAITSLHPPADMLPSQSMLQAVPKAAPAAAKARAAKAGNDVPLTKEAYWDRKEERDIETGKRIRRSGVWQAALQSLAPLQFNAGGTLESYLATVEKIAEEGLKFVQKD